MAVGDSTSAAGVAGTAAVAVDREIVVAVAVGGTIVVVVGIELDPLGLGALELGFSTNPRETERDREERGQRAED